MKLCSQLCVLLSMTTAMQLPQPGLQCILKSVNHFWGVPAFTQQTHSSKRHPAPYRKEEKQPPRDSFQGQPATTWFSFVTCVTTHSKALATIAVAGRHISPYHGGKQPCQDCPPANATPSESSVSAACLPHYPQQGQWDRSPPNSSLVFMPYICASVYGIDFPRETQTNICSPG